MLDRRICSRHFSELWRWCVSTELIADGTTGEVNIYARNGFDFSAAEFSFTSGDTAVAAITGGTGLNPAIGPGGAFGDRFDVDPILSLIHI